MKNNFRMKRLVLAGVLLGMACPAWAVSIIPGEWETSSHIVTPAGVQVINSKVCHSGTGVTALLNRQQGEQCGPWRQVSASADGTRILETTCTQAGPGPGGEPLMIHVRATIGVARDGRSAQGEVLTSGTVNGTSFTAPPTHFRSRYLGACPGSDGRP